MRNNILLIIALFPMLGFAQFGNRQIINTFSVTHQINRAIPGDIDGDGYVDVVIAAGNYDEIVWFKNDGEGGFGLPITVTDMVDGSLSISLSDVDMDGDLDVCGSSFTDSRISWFANDGNGEFGPRQIIADGENRVRWITSEDVDGDGDEDLVATSYTDSTLMWYRNDGGGTYWEKTILRDDARESRYVQFADLNGDNIRDLLFLSNYNDVSWFPAVGDGTFGTEEFIATIGGYPEWAEAVDVDGDGDLDVLTASSIYEGIWMYRNNGDGTFTDEETIGPEIVFHPRSVIGVDYDVDGDMDLLAGGDDEIVLFVNDGTGLFDEKIMIENYDMDKAVLALSDLDNDGDLDFIESGQWSGYLGWYENYQFYPYKVSGNVYFDVNGNHVRDDDDVPFGDFVSIISDPLSDFTFTNAEGDYSMIFSDSIGTYTIAPNDDVMYWEVTSDSTYYTININEDYVARENLDFGFTPIEVVEELDCDLVHGFPRCGREVSYWATIENTGTTIPSGKVVLELDPKLEYVSSEIEPESVVGNTITWTYDDLLFYETLTFPLRVQYPVPDDVGETVTNILTSTIEIAATEVFSCEHVQADTILCSFDPNDKAVFPAGIDAEGYIPMTTESLDYLIRFQNTGNDTAFVVEIEDQLSAHLDWSSLDIKSSSHDMAVHVSELGVVQFSFEDIYLPDSIVDEPSSHGYVKYTINLKEGLAEGTVIENTADIYFDFNAAITTNTTTNTLALWASLDENSVNNNAISFYPNPVHSILTITHQEWAHDAAYHVKVYNLLGEIVYQSGAVHQETYAVNMNAFDKGVYLVSVVSATGEEIATSKVIKQ
jgi:hypothetical protein